MCAFFDDLHQFAHYKYTPECVIRIGALSLIFARAPALCPVCCAHFPSFLIFRPCHCVSTILRVIHRVTAFRRVSNQSEVSVRAFHHSLSLRLWASLPLQRSPAYSRWASTSRTTWCWARPRPSPTRYAWAFLFNCRVPAVRADPACLCASSKVI
jgi:hypothetical protein